MNYYNICKVNFVGKINGLSEMSRKTSKILAAKKNLSSHKKDILKRRKVILGDDIRHHLLAYAFLLGKKYHDLESKCAEDNKPSVEHIFDIIKLHVSSYDFRKINIETIKEWLSQ